MIRVSLAFYIESELMPLSPPFRNPKDRGPHRAVAFPHGQFCLLHPRLYLSTRIDATPRKNIISGIDTSHNQIRAPRGVPLTRSFLVSRWNRGPLLFSQPSISMTQPPDGHSRRDRRRRPIVLLRSLSFSLSRRRERRYLR